MVPRVEALRQPIRVLLVEDNDVFRQALELLLELQEGLEVVGRRRGRLEGGQRLPGVPAARGRDGLQAARHGRGRDDDRADARLPERRGRLPDRLRQPA